MQGIALHCCYYITAMFARIKASLAGTPTTHCVRGGGSERPDAVVNDDTHVSSEPRRDRARRRDPRTLLTHPQHAQACVGDPGCREAGIEQIAIHHTQQEIYNARSN